MIAARMKLECAPGLSLRTSRSALNLILNNLIENAVKYSPKGAPITITVDAQKDATRLSVKDHGIGLAPKERRRLFKMFHRSDVAIQKAIPGTGLGLYIVKTAVRVLGGRVWVESEGQDRGSTFHVELPTRAHFTTVSHV